MTAAMFSKRSGAEKLALPMGTWMLAVLSTRYSTRPCRASRITRSRSSSETIVPALGLGIKGEGNRYLGEIQQQFRWERIGLIGGVGYVRVDEEVETTDFWFDTTTREEGDTDHTNLYAYVPITYPRNVTWTIGASGDIFRSDMDGDEDSFNPKFGVTWNPFPSTTLRAAAFRVFKRTLPTEQTIEPTQVAGFNQFFDDPIATKSWRYGGAVDQKFSQSVFGGVEFSRR